MKPPDVGEAVGRATADAAHLGTALAGAGLDPVVGQHLCGQHRQRSGGGTGDHRAAATAAGSGRGTRAPAFAGATGRSGDVVSGVVQYAGRLAGDQTRAAAADGGAAGPPGHQVGSGAGAGGQHHQPDSGFHRAGDRPGPPDHLRSRPRRQHRRPSTQFYRQVRQVQRLLVAAFERDSEWRPSAAREEDDRA